MPLTPGAPVKTSIKELIDSYKRKGSIGTSHPKNMKKAMKQIVAISYANARKGK